jgi:hypothetical protein NreA
MSHATDPAILARLRRAEGHLRAVVAMVQEGRDCVAIAQQLQAVEAAIVAAKREMIQHHIDHRLEDRLPGDDSTGGSLAAELKTLARYL